MKKSKSKSSNIRRPSSSRSVAGIASAEAKNASLPKGPTGRNDVKC